MARLVDTSSLARRSAAGKSDLRRRDGDERPKTGRNRTGPDDAAPLGEHLHLGDQLLLHVRAGLVPRSDVSGLRDVVAGAGGEAFVPVAVHGTGGYGDHGQVRELRHLADLSHGLVPVQLGHHDVHQDQVDVTGG